MSQSRDSTEVGLKTVYFRVKGRVQGVFFRASTRSTAEKIGLSGWVKNMPDGDVEGMVTGPEKPLQEFIAWLHHGPKLSSVTAVEISPHQVEQFSGFEIR